MARNWSAEERRELERALRSGAALRCPACGASIARTDVPPKRELPYVRHRTLLICGACGCSAAVDLPPG